MRGNWIARRRTSDRRLLFFIQNTSQRRWKEKRKKKILVHMLLCRPVIATLFDRYFQVFSIYLTCFPSTSQSSLEI